MRTRRKGVGGYTYQVNDDDDDYEYRREADVMSGKTVPLYHRHRATTGFHDSNTDNQYYGLICSNCGGPHALQNCSQNARTRCKSRRRCDESDDSMSSDDSEECNPAPRGRYCQVGKTTCEEPKPIPKTTEGCKRIFRYQSYDCQPCLKYFIYVIILLIIISMEFQKYSIRSLEETVKKTEKGGFIKTIIDMMHTNTFLFLLTVVEIVLLPVFGKAFDLVGPQRPLSLALYSSFAVGGLLCTSYVMDSHGPLVLARLLLPLLQGFPIMSIISLELYPKGAPTCMCWAIAEIGFIHNLADQLVLFSTPYIVANYGLVGMLQVGLFSSFCAVVTLWCWLPVDERKGFLNEHCEIGWWKTIIAAFRRTYWIGNWREAFTNRHIQIFFCRTLIGLAFYAYQAVFNTTIPNHLGTSDINARYFLLGVSGVALLLHLAIIYLLVAKPGMAEGMKWGCLLQFCCFAWQLVTTNHWQLYGLALLQIVALGVTHVFMTYEIAVTTDACNLGFAMGINMALYHVTRFIAPFLGDQLAATHQKAVSYFGLGATMVASFIAFGVIRPQREPCCPKECGDENGEPKKPEEPSWVFATESCSSIESEQGCPTRDCTKCV